MKTIALLLACSSLVCRSALSICFTDGTNIIWSPDSSTILTTAMAAASMLPAATITRQTNWPSGQWMTNNSGHEIVVSCSVTNTSALIGGFCGMELWVGYTTNLSVLAGVSATTLKTVIGGLATTQEFPLRGLIPNGVPFCFTNSSTGIGNDGRMRIGSGQCTVLP